jgi:CBS domain-containing protein
MRIEQVMTRTVEVVHPEETIADAAQLMREFDVGVLPVCDGDLVLGTLTDRDITVRATAYGRDPVATRVYEIMTADIVSCYADQDLAMAARTMKEERVRRLIVVDRGERLVGIVSLDDLAARTGDDALSGDVLKTLSAASAWPA